MADIACILNPSVYPEPVQSATFVKARPFCCLCKSVIPEGEVLKLAELQRNSFLLFHEPAGGEYQQARLCAVYKEDGRRRMLEAGYVFSTHSRGMIQRFASALPFVPRQTCWF